jgi:hypothetical protein
MNTREAWVFAHLAMLLLGRLGLGEALSPLFVNKIAPLSTLEVSRRRSSPVHGIQRRVLVRTDISPSTRLHIRVNGNSSEDDFPSIFGRLRRIATYPIRKVKQVFHRTKDYVKPSATEPGIAAQAKDDQSQKYEPADNLSPGSVESPPPSKDSPTATPSEAKDPFAVAGRSATAAVDLSGVWDLIVTESFKEEYDKYLMMLGQPFLVRSVAVQIVGMTTEETVQKEDGRMLFIRGRNVRGLWERTLIASGPERGVEFQPLLTPITTADDEDVMSEAWWENNGTVHRSWLRGVAKYGGGDFESNRYFEDGGKTLACKSTFHPNDASREKATVTWRFHRQNV